MLALLCLPIIFTGCARPTDPKTYGIPIATAAGIKTTACPSKQAEPAKAVACPETGQ